MFVLSCLLFLVNEIMRLVQGRSAIGGAPLFAIIAATLLIAAQFFLGCFHVYQHLFGNWRGAIVGDSFIWSVMQSLAICTLPVVVLVLGLVRQNQQ